MSEQIKIIGTVEASDVGSFLTIVNRNVKRAARRPSLKKRLDDLPQTGSDVFLLTENGKPVNVLRRDRDSGLWYIAELRVVENWELKEVSLCGDELQIGFTPLGDARPRSGDGSSL